MISLIVDGLLTKSERISNWMFATILFGIYGIMKIKSVMVPSFRRRLKEKNFTAQIKVRGNALGRTYTFDRGRVTSMAAPIETAHMSMIFRDSSSAVQLMTEPTNFLKQINAMKNFVVDVEGEDDYAIWFMQTLKMLPHLRATPAYGTPVGKQTMRYVNNTGPPLVLLT